MAWDSSRPVPWNRLIREWLIYAAIMSAVFLIFFRGDNVLAIEIAAGVPPGLSLDRVTIVPAGP